MEEAILTSKGQITVPRKIRKALGLEKGSRVKFILDGKEAVMLPKIKEPMKQLEELRKEVHFSNEEIKEMIKESKKEWSKIDIY